jgi:adenylate kinase
VIKKLNPSAIVVVEADPKEIYDRRINDTTRNRDPDSIEKINEHQQINRSAAMAYAAISGSTVKIIYNHDNAIEDAVAEASPILK